MVPLLPPPPVRFRMPVLMVVPPEKVFCADSAAVPVPLLTKPPVPETTPESRLLPGPSKVRVNPALVVAPMTIKFPLLHTIDCGTAIVVPMAQVFVPA